MVELNTQMPGMAEADAKLAALEAAESGQDGNTTANEAPATADQASSANTSGERAPATGDTAAQTSEPKQADTPATTDKAETAKAESRNPKAEAENQQPERKPSKYERDAERLPKTWKEFNARRAEQEAEYKARQDALARSQAEFERRQAEFASTSQTPGAADYEAAAARYSAQAKALEIEAAKLEEAGNYDGAEAKRKAAAKTEFWAEQYRDAAAAEKANPPDSRRQQAQAAVEQARKEWTVKAGTEFPDLLKQDSELQKRVAAIYQAEPKLRSEPQGIYWAARLATAETAAASVPALKGELTKARNRIAELERLTAPAGSGAPATIPGPRGFDEMSEAEQLRELTKMASERGTL